MRIAYDFTASKTSECIKENEGYESFAAKVNKKCMFCFVPPYWLFTLF